MKIETVDGPIPKWRLSDGDTAVELAPSRGALITSFVSEGTELLFLDESTFVDVTKNVRGGVPLLFPFAGKPPAGSTLPQHGFARRMAWDVVSAISDDATARLECRLVDTAETRAAWPHAFDVRFAVSLYGGRLMLEWSFHNTGETAMPLHFGIHPYFRVGEKSAVRVEGTTGHAYDNKAGLERQVDAVDFSSGEVDLHFASSAGGTTLARGDGSRVRLSWTPQFDTLVVWTLPGQPFICVEPWTARGAQPAHLSVAPHATERLAIEVWLER